MRKLIMLLAAMSIAGPAAAKSMDWHGTMVVKIGALDSIALGGSGVATVNDSSGGSHLSTLRLAGGITDSGTVPVTDPNSTAQIKSIIISGTLGTETLTGISGAPPMGRNEIPLKGFTRICLFTADCTTNLPLDNTANDGNTAVGVGGLLTIGGNGSIRISIEGAPWTLATVTLLNQTGKGNFITLSQVGFVHGAASATNSTTASDSGVIQLVAPQSITSTGVVGNATKMSLFLTLTLHFIPEPGLLLLLGSGVAGLALLGRSRMKR